ncbi:MAG: thioredoxin family protein [Saprospiraceae bacterium]|nr:thioredoxin family protein [Saprospiraceae bacterium]
MIRIILFCLGLFIYTSLAGQGSTVQFSEQGWSSILERAAQENKLIFLDAYTTWCGPCKQMDKKVFPDTRVADFFNSNFVNAKIDMEKGEGVGIAKNYSISAYPSLLFIDGNGKMVHSAVGYHSSDQILDLASAAMDDSNNLLGLEKRFQEGERDPEFLLKYTRHLAELMNQSHLPVAEAYMEGQDDWTSSDHLDFIYSLTTDTDTKLFDYLVENKNLFASRFGEEMVGEKIKQLVYQEAEQDQGDQLFAKMDRLFQKVYPDKATSLSAQLKMGTYRQQGDRENFALSAIDYMKGNKEASPDELNELAWTFFQVIESKKQLKQASKWAKKAIKKDPQVYYYETLASLYEKMGVGSKAVKAAKKGIALSASTGEDPMVLEEILQRLQ